MFKLLSKIAINIIITAVLLFVVHKYSGGWFTVEASGYDIFLTFIIIAVIFFILNSILKRILRIVTFPLKLITFGRFSIVLNVFIIYLFAYVVNNADITIAIGLGTLLHVILLSIILSLPQFLVKKVK